MRFFSIFLVAFVYAQQRGKQTPEKQPKINITVCNTDGCSEEANSVTMDANWRWIHKAGGWDTNCYGGDGWNKTVCPDPVTCAKTCAIDGINTYNATYGISEVKGGVKLRFKTGGNVGSRLYLLDSKENYRIFKLVNKEFAFDIDMSKIGCGINGAVYFVEMPEDGGMSKFPNNKAGAKYGTGYCDAQCPHDIKFINGEANLPYKGSSYGSCCSEMDIWEANKMAAAFTPHPAKGQGPFRCRDDTCKGVTSTGGCDFNNYRMNNSTFLGPNMIVDTTRPFTVVTQFISSDGTDNGDLQEIKRIYIQDGKRFENAQSNIPGGSQFNSLTDNNCKIKNTVFQENDGFIDMGGMKQMGESLKRGVALVFSIWDDYGAYMLWLDSIFPVDAPPSKPGVTRGPCPITSGRPADVEKEQADAWVSYSNVKYGAIGSTHL